MNFPQALRSLRDGRIVRRDTWPENTCLILSDGLMQVVQGALIEPGKTIAPYQVSQADVWADDWSLVMGFIAQNRIRPAKS